MPSISTENIHLGNSKAIAQLTRHQKHGTGNRVHAAMMS